MGDLLSGVRLDYAWEQILGVIQNPYSNLTAALLLLAAGVVFVLFILMVVIAIFSPAPRKPVTYDEDELRSLLEILETDDEIPEGETVEGWDVPGSDSVGGAQAAAPRVRVKGLSWQLWAAVMLVGMLVAFVAVGWTTTASEVCTACHESTPHSETVAAGGTDPHEAVACVRCHESSGWVGRVTVEVPERLGHIIAGAASEPEQGTYGIVTGTGCGQCHAGAITGVIEDAERGIRMSHAEPLAAGAQCRDCHTLATGVVSSVTVGMTPCLRCHNGDDEPATCTTCHTKDVGAAARSRRNPAEMTGRELVPTPDCGGCHDEATQCDPCHGGVRMPHSDLFMWWGHARAGAEDIWKTGGKTCARCHTETRRPCTQCHAFFPGHPREWRATHGAGGRGASCDSCHRRRAYSTDRDFCQLCHGEQVTQ